MARTLYLTGRSPFARKVRLLLLEKGLEFTPSWVDLAAKSKEFRALSPLDKVPVLVDEDGTLVFDSTVIAEYLDDRYPEPPAYGRTWRERLANRALEELGDTLSDQAIVAWRARTQGDGVAVTRALDLAARALTEAQRRLEAGLWPEGFGAGAMSLLSGVGYYELRHGRELLERHAPLVGHLSQWSARPSVTATVPTL